MVDHKCDKCEKIFKQKNLLDKHNKLKRPCKKVGDADTVPSNAGISEIVRSHPRSETMPLSWYSEKMPDIFNFVTRKLHPMVAAGETDIIINAQVKTGKRFIAQAYSVFTTPMVGEKIVHVFVSAWVRRADERQRKELDIYFKGTKSDPRVFKINTEKARLRCIERLKKIILNHDKLIVHLDELDYGSGSEQHMAAVYEYCINQEKIVLISYSASYEEAVLDSLTGTARKKPVLLTFNPPEEYRGAKWYCDNNLVNEAKPFFDMSREVISESGKALLERAKAGLYSEDIAVNSRKLLIIRNNTEFKNLHELIESDKFPELCGNGEPRIITEYIHSSSDISSLSVKWDDYTWFKKRIENVYVGKCLLILFIDKSSSRSTDWFCHPWLFAYHDYHPPDTPMNTCIQSNLRPVYYTNKMCDGVKVYQDQEFFPEIHGQKDVIEYVAGLKALGDIGARPVSSRTKVFEQLKTYGPVIEIHFSNTEFAALEPHIVTNLNEYTAPIIQGTILNKLKPSERRIIGERTLKGKRTFNYAANGGGGIYTVARNKLRNINSRPGGGIGEEGGEVYNRRGEYFWAEFAMEDLEFTYEGEVAKIPKGTVYITHGIADPVVDDDGASSTISDKVHRVTGNSMYAS